MSGIYTIILSLQDMTNQREGQTLLPSNTLLPSRSESALYSRYQPYSCDKICKHAHHRYTTYRGIQPWGLKEEAYQLRRLRTFCISEHIIVSAKMFNPTRVIIKHVFFNRGDLTTGMELDSWSIVIGNKQYNKLEPSNGLSKKRKSLNSSYCYGAEQRKFCTLT